MFGSHNGFKLGDRVTFPDNPHSAPGTVFIITEWVKTPGLSHRQNDCLVRNTKTNKTNWAATSIARKV